MWWIQLFRFGELDAATIPSVSNIIFFFSNSDHTFIWSFCIWWPFKLTIVFRWNHFSIKLLFTVLKFQVRLNMGFVYSSHVYMDTIRLKSIRLMNPIKVFTWMINKVIRLFDSESLSLTFCAECMFTRTVLLFPIDCQRLIWVSFSPSLTPAIMVFSQLSLFGNEKIKMYCETPLPS